MYKHKVMVLAERIDDASDNERRGLSSHMVRDQLWQQLWRYCPQFCILQTDEFSESRHEWPNGAIYSPVVVTLGFKVEDRRERPFVRQPTSWQLIEK